MTHQGRGMGQENPLRTLGRHLRAARKEHHLSLGATAKAARISPAYVQKLENGVVRNPSPRVLHRLGGVLELSYAWLMEMAGYHMPGGSQGPRPVPEGELGAHAAASALAQAVDALPPAERNAVAAFMAYLKEQRG